MSRATEIVRDNVRLTSLGLSAHFVGYFERSTRFSQETIDKAKDHFLRFFGTTLSEFCVVSSLHISSDIEDVRRRYSWSADDIELAEKLIKRGFVRNVDFGVLEAQAQDGSSTSDDIYDAQFDVLTEFAREQVSPNDFDNLSRCSMSVDGIYGFAFFVLTDEPLIVYPHEDTGYGVISDGSDASTQIGVQFLKSIEQDPDFGARVISQRD